jgi:hypothetical protein
LLDNKADVSCKNKEEKCALDLAEQTDRKDLIALIKRYVPTAGPAPQKLSLM